MSETKDQDAAVDAALEDAFLELDEADLGMRPFSIGTFRLARKMGLTVLTGQETEDEVSEDEAMEQLIRLAWAQCAPLPEVLRALREGKEAWMEKVDLWAHTVAPSMLSRMAKEIERLGRQAAAALVEVEAQPKEPAPKGAKVRKPRGKS
jgi:hypothetical protein